MKVDRAPSTGERYVLIRGICLNATSGTFNLRHLIVFSLFITSVHTPYFSAHPNRCRGGRVRCMQYR